MNKIFIILIVTLSFASCKSNDKKAKENNLIGGETSKNDSTGSSTGETKTTHPDSGSLTTIEWLDGPVKNLGKLKKDKEVDITFRFKNSGDNMLVIENVSAGCGCTIPEKPQQPFAPGEEGVIKAKFNGSGHGTISKNVTVIANTTPKEHVLTFSGEIVEK